MNNNNKNNRSNNVYDPVKSTNIIPISDPHNQPTVFTTIPNGSDLTYKKNMVFYDVIKDFSVKDKRKVFAEMRTTNIKVNIDTFFPQYGLTAGEFSTWAILTENNRKKR